MKKVSEHPYYKPII